MFQQKILRIKVAKATTSETLIFETNNITSPSMCFAFKIKKNKKKVIKSDVQTHTQFS